MSIPRAYSLNGRGVHINVAQPMECFLNFVVDSTNGNGLGIRSLKSNGFVERVFMYSTVPSASPISDSFPDKNPCTTAAGMIIVQMKNNFNRFLGAKVGCAAPTSGSPLKIDNGATLTIGEPYIITTVGDATAAQFKTLGLPAGVTPAVGAVFVALATGAGSGNTSTTRVIAVGYSGVESVEVVGDANVMQSSPVGSKDGQIVMFRCVGPAVTMASYTPAGTNNAPALTVNPYTPAGTNNAPALSMNSYTPAGTNANDGPPETFTGTAATLTGSVAAPAFTGTQATLTGSVAAPAFTGAAATLTGTMSMTAVQPANGTVIGMRLSFDGSSVNIDGL
jgi:hypothetical protein